MAHKTIYAMNILAYHKPLSKNDFGGSWGAGRPTCILHVRLYLFCDGI